jgi:hypothetical protein
MYILDMCSTVQVVYTACCNDATNILYCTGIRTAELMFVGHNIYLHDRGQFWPGLEMARTGLSHMLYLTEVYGPTCPQRRLHSWSPSHSKMIF